MDGKKTSVLGKVAFPLFFLLIFVIVWIFRGQLYDLFLSEADLTKSAEKVKAWVESSGIYPPLVFMGLQFIQVVIFIIPGEVVQVAGGYLFGPFWGVLYSILGITLGSVANFYLARWLGNPFVHSILGRKELAKFEKMRSAKSLPAIFFLFFLIPGIPKDSLCYFAGLSVMPAGVFLIISTLGRLPALIASVFFGSAVAKNHWSLAIVIFVAAVILFFLGFIFRDKLQDFLHDLAGKLPFIQHRHEKQEQKKD